MGLIAHSFLAVALLATVSRWHALQTPLFFDNAVASVSQAGKVLIHGDERNATTEHSQVVDAKATTGWQQWPISAIWPQRTLQQHQQQSEDIAEQVDWLNSLVQPLIPSSLWSALPRILKTWLRNYVFGMMLYYGLNLVWAYYIYFCFGGDLFPKGNIPGWRDMLEQAWVSFWSIPFYSALPVVTEELMERGWTLGYAHVSDVGVVQYVAYLYMYMAFVEFGVYWAHRGLHDWSTGYRVLHNIHHKYNKEHTLSPFAGLAFHPFDGLCQAAPYLLVLFVVPMHFMTHEFLLFLTGVWTTNIHDNVHANLLPVMGAGWHTIHHTSYKHNYGHYFVIMDWFFGTLISPEEYEAEQATRLAKVAHKQTAAVAHEPLAGHPIAFEGVSGDLDIGDHNMESRSGLSS